MWAQTDYTNKVGTSQSAWSGSGFYTGKTVTPFGASEAIGLAEFYGSSDAGEKLRQTVTGLEKGVYDVTVFATSHNAWGNHSATLAADAEDVAYIFAKPDGSTTLKQFFKARKDSGMSEDEPYKVTISDIEVAGGELTIGLALDKSGQTEWQTIQIYQLTRTGNLPLTALVTAYETALNNAETTAETTKTIGTSALAALNTAISTYSSVDENSEDALNTAIDALTNANNAAETSIASYEVIANGTIATNVLGKWAISTTAGGLAVNTWSTEGDTDGSKMTKPFIQDWVGSGTPLGAGKLYYRLEGLNPGEKYSVSALVRVLDESGAAVSGATFYVNSETKDIAANGSACTNGIAGTMNLAAEVDANGVLEIGIESANDATFNWMAIKNVTIAEYAGVKVSDIELNQTSADLTMGDMLTLAATVTPDNADDKTFTWSSSDETVATVTAAGIVSAIGEGSATITATANDGSDVSASCTVNVASASAPSFYSEIAAGDFYIMNAATGKFLGGANDWGTHASIINHGIPFTVAVADGKYTLDSHTYNNSTDHFFNGSYVDQPSTKLDIVALGDGKYSISTGENAFVTALAGNTKVESNAANANSTFAQWYFLSKTDRDNMLEAATEDNPADATYYIKEANISRNLRVSYNKSGWTNIAYGEDKNQDRGNYNAQVWNGTVDVYQTIENLPNGTYTLKMQGFSSGTDVKLYANSEEIAVLAQPDGISTQSAAAAAFSNGEYVNTLSVTVTDHTMKIGLKGDCTNKKWLCYDNFELYMTEYATDPLASESDLQNLADAIAAAEAKFGFEEGEYAPYNNIEACQAIAAAKAANVEGAFKSVIDAAINSLNDISWTPNTSEVNAIYWTTYGEDAAKDASGRIFATGWGLEGGTDAYNVRIQNDVTNNPGLAAVENNTAVFGKFDMTYGETTGYTMPLKANKIYKLNFKYGGWTEPSNTTVKMIAPDKSELVIDATMIVPGGSQNGNSDINNWWEWTGYFVAPTTGNYVLKFKNNENGQHQKVIGNMSLLSATEIEFADATLPKYAPGTYPSVKINREFSSEKWSTAVYPFAVSDGNIAVLESYDAASGTLAFESAATSEANVPFLLKNDGVITLSDVEVTAAAATDATAGNASLKGVYAVTEVDNSAINYVLSNNTIYKVGANKATVNPYRAYIQLAETAGAARELTFTVDGEATAIEGIAAEKAMSGEIYNLNGQRVKTAKKGIYVVNGKAVIVK